MKKENGIVVGKTWKKKFFIAFLTGFLALGGLISVFGFTGSAFALPLGGIGDFYVEFDELKGTEFQLLPQIGETGNSDAEPMVRNKMDTAEITNLHIYKDLKLPTGKWVRFHVKATGKTTIEGLIQDARFIDADLSFNELNIREKNTDDFSKNWSQDAKTITIKDAKIVTDYLFQNMVSLEGAKISVESIKEPKMTGK
ncbi:hypothetical protein KK120_20155 [Virgibacillus dakarensis]|nr:hypothetical protein [Virgibacillus dakarensis]